jgi:hypothetical protein
MGCVSLREDTTERFCSEENSINLSLSIKGALEVDPYDNDRRLQLLVSANDSLLRKITKLLDLATTPDFDLILELGAERKKRECLEAEVAILQRQLLSHRRQVKSLETKAVDTEKPEVENLLQSKRSQRKQAQLRMCEICQVQVKESKYENHKRKAHRVTPYKKKALTIINTNKERTVQEQQFNGIRM